MTVADGASIKESVLAQTGRWELVDKVDAYSRSFPASGSCWDWTGGLSMSGGREYGVLYFPGEMHLAHRASYQGFILQGKPIPQGMDVLHSCDNTLCVFPGHLHLETRSEQVLASVERGTHARKNYHITPEVSETIRQIVYVGQYENADIAQKYDTSAGQISKIAHRQIYSDRPLNEEEREALKARNMKKRRDNQKRRRKLTDEQAREVWNSNETQSVLAKRHGVAQGTISAIKLRKRYRDVE
ncbi:MAG: hypothetical protein IIA89_12110 [Chloroflexi bacterium]|nr:hypothetical protein [Chloroflexota bacterium]